MIPAAVFEALPRGGDAAVAAARDHATAISGSDRAAAAAEVYAALLLRITAKITGDGKGVRTAGERVEILRGELEAGARALGFELSEIFKEAKAAGNTDVQAARKFGLYTTEVSRACVLAYWLAYKYVAITPLGLFHGSYSLQSRVRAALLANANMGGDNTARGVVLGSVLGLALGKAAVPADLSQGLAAHTAVAAEVEAFAGMVDRGLGGSDTAYDHGDL